MVSAFLFVAAVVTNTAIVNYTDGFLDQSWQSFGYFVTKAVMVPLGAITVFSLVMFLIEKWGDGKDVSDK